MIHEHSVTIDPETRVTVTLPKREVVIEYDEKDGTYCICDTTTGEVLLDDIEKASSVSSSQPPTLTTEEQAKLDS